MEGERESVEVGTTTVFTGAEVRNTVYRFIYEARVLRDFILL